MSGGVDPVERERPDSASDAGDEQDRRRRRRRRRGGARDATAAGGAGASTAGVVTGSSSVKVMGATGRSWRHASPARAMSGQPRRRPGPGQELDDHPGDGDALQTVRLSGRAPRPPRPRRPTTAAAIVASVRRRRARQTT